MKKILLVDDEPIIIEGLNKMVDWKKLDCNVIGSAENGQQALELVKEKRPDIIISDIRMPKIDGLEFISEVKNEKFDCQIIILTGYRQFEYAQKAIKLGVFRFLVKPTKLNELTNTIKLAVGKLDKERQKAKEYTLLKQKFINLKDNENNNKFNDVKKINYTVYQAVEYINKNYYNKIDLQTVADELFISTWHLSKLIKKELGINFVQLLNNIRLEKAKELLISSNLKIYEIAEEVGYSDIAYFNRIFKKNINITPNQYRNKYYKIKSN